MPDASDEIAGEIDIADPVAAKTFAGSWAGILSSEESLKECSSCALDLGNLSQ